MAQDDAGRTEEAERMRRQLEDDIAALAARFSGPEFHARRHQWAEAIASNQSPPINRQLRRMNLQNARLSVILDPGNPRILNNLAWSLTSVPDDPWFDPKQGLAEANKAIKVQSNNSLIWNTLGVAAFRAGDWTTARDALKKSINMTGGGRAHDWFFLAMTQWNQGNHAEARQSFDLALASLKNELKDDTELLRFRAEAAALMGLPGPKPDPRS
jgi:tetratricopeptide (TPR) repeat protein